jgi:hypothetical protein
VIKSVVGYCKHFYVNHERLGYLATNELEFLGKP